MLCSLSRGVFGLLNPCVSQKPFWKLRKSSKNLTTELADYSDLIRLGYSTETASMIKGINLSISNSRIEVLKNPSHESVYYQQIRIFPVFFSKVVQSNFLRNLGTLLFTIFNFRLLVAGNLFSSGENSFAPANTNAFQNKAIGWLKKKSSFAVLVKDISKDSEMAEILKNHRFLPLKGDSVMELHIMEHWRTMEDYCNQLSSKYKSRYIKIKSGFDSVVEKDLTFDDLIKFRSEIDELLKQVIEHQEFKLGSPNADLLTRLKECIGDQLIVKGYFFENKLLAFSVFLIRNSQVENICIGYSKELNKTYSIYHNLLIKSVELVLILNKKTLILGRTALEAKAILGAIPRQTISYLYVKNPILRFLIYRSISKYYSIQPTPWEKRHPFKQYIDSHVAIKA